MTPHAQEAYNKWVNLRKEVRKLILICYLKALLCKLVKLIEQTHLKT